MSHTLRLIVRATAGYRSVARCFSLSFFIFLKYIYSWLIACYYTYSNGLLRFPYEGDGLLTPQSNTARKWAILASDPFMISCSFSSRKGRMVPGMMPQTPPPSMLSTVTMLCSRTTAAATAAWTATAATCRGSAHAASPGSTSVTRCSAPVSARAPWKRKKKKNTRVRGLLLSSVAANQTVGDGLYVCFCLVLLLVISMRFRASGRWWCAPRTRMRSCVPVPRCVRLRWTSQ